MTGANASRFGVCPTLVRRMLVRDGFPVNRCSLRNLLLLERFEGHFIALLLYSDDAKPAGWFYQEEANKVLFRERVARILFSNPHVSKPSVRLAPHDSVYKA